MATEPVSTFGGITLPDIDELIAMLPAGLAVSDEELRARVQLAYLYMRADLGVETLEQTLATLRTRAEGQPADDPFGERIHADSFPALAQVAAELERARGIKFEDILAILFEVGSLAAAQGRRLIAFLALNGELRKRLWDHLVVEVEREGGGYDRLADVGRRFLLWIEVSSLAIGEGYRFTEREWVARDVAARRAALDELLGSVPIGGYAAARLRRLATRYGLPPDDLYRVVAILPGRGSDPSPEDPGIDDEDLDQLARSIEGRLRRQPAAKGAAIGGIRLPLATSWRGLIVALLTADSREWRRLGEAASAVLGQDVPGPDAGAGTPTWTAIATTASGARDLGRAVGELQEGIRVAGTIGRTGSIDDLAELGLERLLLSDPALAREIVERELGQLLHDPRLGDELVQTLQVYFDTGENQRETARRLHLAERTVAYRLERAEALLGHSLDETAGRRLNVALILYRTVGRAPAGPT